MQGAQRALRKEYYLGAWQGGHLPMRYLQQVAGQGWGLLL